MTGALMSTIGSFAAQKIKVTQMAATSTKTSGTNNLTSGSISTTAGNIYIVMLAYDPSGNAVPTVTVSDGTNTYTALAAAFTAPATTTAGGGVITRAFITTAGATASRTITPTFSASIATKAMIVIELTGATTTQRNVATTSRGTTASPNYAGPSGNAFDMILTILGQESNTGTFSGTTGSTSTSGGVWSTVSSTGTTGGNSNTNQVIAYQYKLLTTTGSQTNAWTLNNAANWSSQSFAIQAA